jgi:cytidylate kinase
MARLNSIVSSIVAENQRFRERDVSGKRTDQPFVTISRQAGAGGEEVMQKLIKRLRERDRAEPQWTGFDRELVEKVAEDHKLAKFLIESLEDHEYNWLRDVLHGLGASRDWPSDVAIYHRVAKTVWALAQAGRVVIVGRGGVFLTEGLPGGVHIRLVASFEHRVQRYAEAEGIDLRQAERKVRELENRRAAFYRRFWPKRPLEPETFTATFNTGKLSDEQIVEAIVAMLAGLQTPAKTSKVSA